MTKIQDDILGIYNNLTEFSGLTLGGTTQIPIKVYFEDQLNSICFEQSGKKIALNTLNYYCENLKNIKNSYLLPSDYDKLMSTLSSIIESGILLHDRVCICPQKYGFDIYETNTRSLKSGPILMAEIRLVSGNSWIFNIVTNFRYRNIL